MQTNLFELSAGPISDRPAIVSDNQCGHDRGLDQFVTPLWAAEEMVADALAGVRGGATVYDLGCGPGAFLRSIPERYQAIGVEIDPAMADLARRNTGRPVIVGDFRTCELPARPDVVVGNPPFDRSVVDGLLQRMYGLLPENDGFAALLLPAYHFQTSRSTQAWSERFSIEQKLVPRDLFPGLAIPLCWAKFRRATNRTMVGFFLYDKAVEVKALTKEAKLVLVHGEPKKGAWRSVVGAALRAAGGRARLASIYEYIGGRRPYENNVNWKQQVRKVLGECAEFIRVAEGEYALAAA